jgi:hypothetical protein
MWRVRTRFSLKLGFSKFVDRDFDNSQEIGANGHNRP